MDDQNSNSNSLLNKKQFINILDIFTKNNFDKNYYQEIFNNYTENLSNKELADSDILVLSGITKYFAIWCSQLSSNIDLPLLIITPNEEQAISLEKTMRFYHDVKSILRIPSWGVAIGGTIAEYAHIRAERATALYRLAHKQFDIVICSIEQWNQLLPNKDFLIRNSLALIQGDTCKIQELLSKLIEWNYVRVPKVTGEGEFSFRGEVLDIYLSKNNSNGKEHTFRITFDFEIIESIKHFDITNQLSTHEIKEICIHPRSEYLWNEETITCLKENILNNFPEVSSTTLNSTIEQLQTHSFDEFDYLYGMWGSIQPQHIVKYFSELPLVVFTNVELLEKQNSFYWHRQEELFLGNSPYICIPRYSRIQDMLREQTAQVTILPVYSTSKSNTLTIQLQDRETQKFMGNIAYFSKYLQERLNTQESYLMIEEEKNLERIVLLLYSTISIDDDKDKTIPERLEQIEKTLGLHIVHIPNEDIQIAEFHLTGTPTIEVFSEVDLLGKKIRYIHTDYSEHIDSVFQISPNDHIVHLQHGIGKFIGLTRMHIAGVEKDYIQLEYANNEKLYVPIEQLNLIQRYIGHVYESTTLDAIGGVGWEKRKNKALEKIEDMSEELLAIHAQRSSRVGFAFKAIEDWENEFIEAFPFEETDDQITVWKEISKDLKKPVPMDRLIVGDVGFGKTELAFRAIFRVVCSGKQAMFLVPTTILAEQHYFSAIERFQKFPIKTAMLSRFLNPKQQKEVIKKLKEGSVDVVIGTHRLIQKDIEFKDLGICIIDEEHRFGVKDKEYIKKYRSNIDCLALSATPIPRTLYQSIVSLRDMSILRTPPQKRLPIRTFVEKFNHQLVADAINKELNRGGQIFYLHNRIATLEEVRKFIEKLVPNASVSVANGQMPPKDLEDTMYRFINKGANVLVSTTIIENGIDIPNVNTIIIDRADNYGIAQLYQLRGRVGRSDRVAYAYLLYPDTYQISEIALKRLTTISDNSELGAGFEISMKDMEARGTGNLLGKEQSGSIAAIGYEHYLRLLDEAMKKMKGHDVLEVEPILELSFNGYIPDSYIEDTTTKMELYKKIASVKSIEEYNTLQILVKDTYGKIPAEIRNLFWISKLRIFCTKHLITLLKDSSVGIELHFTKLSKLPVDKITKLITEKKVKIKAEQANVLILEYKNIEEKDSLEKKYELLETFFTLLDS